MFGFVLIVLSFSLAMLYKKTVYIDFKLNSRLKEDTHKNCFFSDVRPLREGGGVNPPEPLRKKKLYDFCLNAQILMKYKKKLPKKLLVMFSTGKNRSTEK